jgi:hypothetical protein
MADGQGAQVTCTCRANFETDHLREDAREEL